MRKTGIGLLVAALLCGLCGCFSMDTDWRPLYSDETSEFWSDISPAQTEDSSAARTEIEESAQDVLTPHTETETSPAASSASSSAAGSRQTGTADTSSSASRATTAHTTARTTTRQTTTRTTASTPASGEMRGVWVSYIELDALLKANPTRAGLQAAVAQLMTDMKANGITDVYWIARANSDAYYTSACYRTAARAQAPLKAGADPLAVAVEAAHARGLKLHAWVNPYRVGKDRSYAACDDVFSYDGKYYYIPTSEKAQALILKGVREIVDGYAVDGIHFDDYFYPAGCADETKKADFERFTPGAGQSCGDYRRAAVSALVRSVYTVCHSRTGCVFGISPSHSLEKNRDQYYADCGRWLAEKGYVDYLCPQVYFGLEHASAAFDRVVDTWLSYPRSSGVKLYFGLGLYKAGLKDDRYAGSGRAEWCQRGDILKREVLFLRSRAKVNGMAFYSYSYFDPSTVAGRSEYDRTYAEKEVKNLLSVLR